MNCQEFVEQVTAFLEGAMSPDAERDFIDHLAQCDGCEHYLDQLRRTSQALQSLTADALAADTLPRDALPGDARSALLDAFRDRR